MATYVFVDNSNIWISARQACEEREGRFVMYDMRLYQPNLKLLAGAGRKDVKIRYFGSFDRQSDPWVWNPGPGEDIICETYERGACSGSEQAVDEVIQLSMYRAMLAEREPGVAVLLTGDGKGFEQGKGFIRTLCDMHERGWGVEVLSWERSCHHALREFAEKNGVFVSLDDYYDAITFLKDRRFAKPLSLTHRRTAQPDVTKDAWLRTRLLQRQNEELRDRLEEAEKKFLFNDTATAEKKRKGKKKYEKAMKKRAAEVKPAREEIVLTPPERMSYESFSELLFA